MIVFNKWSYYQRYKIQKKVLQTIIVVIFRDFVMFYQIFFSPQVKQSVIISNKHVIYGLPHELPYDLRQNLKKLGKIKKI